MPIPGVRGGAVKKPKPFQRPGIELSTGAKKRWVEVDPRHVRQGDIIRGMGLVVDIEYHQTTGFLAEAYVLFRMKSGDYLRIDHDQTVIAFTEAEGEPVG